MKKILSIAALGSLLVGYGAVVATQAVAQTPTPPENQLDKQEKKKPGSREEVRKKREEERKKREKIKEQMEQAQEQESSTY